MTLEEVILCNLVSNEEYTRKVLPHLKGEYFQNASHKVVFELVLSFVAKYASLPSRSVLLVELNDKTMSEEDLSASKKAVADLFSVAVDTTAEKQQWLVEQTEKFCKEKSLYLAINDAILAYSGKHSSLTRDGIPARIENALSVTFDSSIGHDLLEDHEARFDSYRLSTIHVPTGVEILDRITGGGWPTKAISIILAGTAGGKSLAMCSSAAAALRNQKNVLYITLEMSEVKIGQRIDANLLGIAVDELKDLSNNVVDQKFKRLREKTKGKVIIKEYSPSTIGAMTIRHLLYELKLKKQFVPDIIFVDYLTLCVSTKFKPGSAGPYEYYKSVAEELRSIAVDFDIPLVTATQTNRTGYSDSDADVDDTGDSFGIPQTADIMFMLYSDDQLKALGQISGKQLKNRYGDPTNPRRFFIGIDYPKMKLYDVDTPTEDTPVFDKTKVANSFNPLYKATEINFEDFK